VNTEEIVQLVRNAFSVTWVDTARRAALMRSLDSYLERAA
jgi:hypothetical protein